MKHLLYTLIIFIFCIQKGHTQSKDILAKSYFLKAEEFYSNNNYSDARINLDKCLSSLGKTNPKLEAMFVRLEKNPLEKQKHLKKYFKIASDEHGDQIEMIELAEKIYEEASRFKKQLNQKLSENENRNWQNEGPIRLNEYFYNQQGKLAFKSNFGRADEEFKNNIGVMQLYSSPRHEILINPKGEQISKNYKYVERIINDFYRVKVYNEDNDVGLLDKNGNEIAKGYSKIMQSRENGFFIVSKKEETYGHNYEGLIDLLGNVIIEPIYSKIGDFHEGLTYVHTRNNKTFYVNKKGETILSLKDKGDWSYSFSEGLAVYQNYGKYKYNKGYIDKNGNIVIQPKFTVANIFSEGLAIANYNKKTVIINTQGKILATLDKEYSINNAHFFGGNAIITYSDNKWVNYYILNHTGKIMYTMQTKKGFGGGYLVHTNVKRVFKVNDPTQGNGNSFQSNVFYLINANGKTITEKYYNFIGTFKNGLAITEFKLRPGSFDIKNNDFYGVIDSNGNEVIQTIYKHIKRKDDGTILASKDGIVYNVINIKR